MVNGAGQTGAAIFGNFTGLGVTNNLRPAGSASVLGTYFGEYSGARDMRIIQLTIKLDFGVLPLLSLEINTAPGML